jgi:hypothetical protein
MSKEEYVASFAAKSIDAIIIKIGDRLCNTIDFQLTQPEYASKYMFKAVPLFNAFYAKKDEIVATYGHETYSRIYLAIEQLFVVLRTTVGSKLILN